jgi:hypothetical protein
MHSDIDKDGSNMGIEEGAFPTDASPWREARTKEEGRGSDPLQFPTLCQAPTQNGMLMFLRHIY